MNSFSNQAISIASAEDIPAIVTLLNNAYRGEESKKGWTTEAHLIAGNVRTDAADVEEVIKKDKSVILKYVDEAGRIIGCVNLQQHTGRLYLGMFAVSPELQGGGVGKKLLTAAEEYSAQLNFPVIYMTVISVRTELIEWYNRHGYKDNGERKPFEEDGLTGRHLQQLEFMVLEKKI